MTNYSGYFIVLNNLKLLINCSPVQTYYTGTESMTAEPDELRSYYHCYWAMVF